MTIKAAMRGMGLLFVNTRDKSCSKLALGQGNLVYRNFSSFAPLGKTFLSSKGSIRPLRGFRMQTEKVKNIPRKTAQEKPVGHSTPGSTSQKSNASSKFGKSRLFFSLKTGVYVVGLSGVVFGGCALWQQQNMIKQHEKYWNRVLEKKTLQKRGEIRDRFNGIWNQLSLVHKVTYCIIGVNCLVLMAWKLPNQTLMSKWFTLSLNAGNHFATMLFSMFSHKSGIHFFVNMYVLSSFCVAWEQLSHSPIGNSNVNGHERYLAFYLTAGMFSSLASILVKCYGHIPHASLGASGALMGLIGYVCEKLPNSRFSIVFLPNHTFSAGSAKNFIIAFDAIGLTIGALSAWRYMIFDHAGHLGGLLFGIWYANRGEKVFDRWSKYVMHLCGKK